MRSYASKTNTFGGFFKEHRIKKGMTLRAFCGTYGLDPGNISKLERGVLSPPEQINILKKYASYLGVREGGKDWYAMIDLASAEAGKIPHDIRGDKVIISRLPVLFRTLKRKKLTGQDLDKLIEKLKKV